MTTETETNTHKFKIHISRIEFDFIGYAWEEEFKDEDDFEHYQDALTGKYSNCSISFECTDYPEPEEDETIEGNGYLNGTEEGYYYRKLEKFLDYEAGWCLLGLEYKVEVL